MHAKKGNSISNNIYNNIYLIIYGVIYLTLESYGKTLIISEKTNVFENISFAQF